MNLGSIKCEVIKVSIADVLLSHNIQYYFHYYGKQEILFQLSNFRVKYREADEKWELYTFELQ